MQNDFTRRKIVATPGVSLRMVCRSWHAHDRLARAAINSCNDVAPSALKVLCNGAVGACTVFCKSSLAKSHIRDDMRRADKIQIMNWFSPFAAAMLRLVPEQRPLLFRVSHCRSRARCFIQLGPCVNLRLLILLQEHGGLTAC